MTYFLVHLAVIFCFMVGMFLIATNKRNNGLVDIGWGAGFVVVSLFSFFRFRDESIAIISSQGLITLLVVLWGARLSTYLFIRNWGKAEDWRYAKWREEWGKWVVLRSFFQVYMLQGALMFVILLPVILANQQVESALFTSVLSIVLTLVGVVLWLVGFCFQAVGDYQLMQFKKDSANKGKIMRHGLWAYTRHPNYFGEATMWWGVFLISLTTFTVWYIAIIAAIGPITIQYLLLNVSGVAMLESKYKANAEFQEYKKNTPTFLPNLKKIISKI